MHERTHGTTKGYGKGGWGCDLLLLLLLLGGNDRKHKGVFTLLIPKYTSLVTLAIILLTTIYNLYTYITTRVFLFLSPSPFPSPLGVLFLFLLVFPVVYV